MTKTPIVNEFMRKLQEAENTGDIKSLVALFEENSELLNVTRQHTHSKSHHHQTPHQNPSSFWRTYLQAFDRVQSHFTNVIDDGHTAVMEWHSEGCLPMGLPIEYNGISIIEYSGDRINRFRTYYDSAAFTTQSGRSEGKSYSESVGVPDLTNQISS